jgi:hypothetical protein
MRYRNLTIMKYHHFLYSYYHMDGVNPSPAIIAIMPLPLTFEREG